VQARASKKAPPKWFLWVFIAIGIAMLGVGLNLVFQSLRCKSWPTTQGTIQSAEIGQHRGSKGGTSYSADVSYGYSVRQTHYTGTKIAFGMMSASASYARGVLNRYPVGAKVPVYYSPNDPGTAVLEPGIHGGVWICFGVGSVFVLFGIMFLLLMKQQRNARQIPSAAETNSQRLNAPQILMAIIIFIFGAFPIIMARNRPDNAIVMYSFGGLFCLAGLYILTYRPGQIRLQQFFSVTISVLMLAVFNWLAFGSGHADLFLGLIMGVLDLMFLAVAVAWLFKQMKVKAPGL
jgi:hypothetical protein